MSTTEIDRIDGLTTSVAVKAPVRIATNHTITLSGLQTVNGVLIVEGDRVLVKDQTDPRENGIYNASTGLWSRSRDFDGNRDVVQGTRILLGEGNSIYRVISANPIVIGVSEIVFYEVGDIHSMHIADFGAIGDGVHDDTAALVAASLALMEEGNQATLLFDPLTYRVYPTGSVSGNMSMQTFSGKDGLTILGRGAKIVLEDTFTGSETLSYWLFQHSRNVMVDGFTFQSVKEPLGEKTLRGQKPTYFNLGCENIVFRNIRQIGGQTGFITDYNTAANDRSLRSRNIAIENFFADGVGYPLSFQNSGDNVRMVNVRAASPGRFYFPYGVTSHYADLTLIDGCETSPSCNLSTGVTADSAYLSDIDLRITAPDLSLTTQGNVVGLTMLVDPGTPVPGTMRNIKVRVDVTLVTAAPLNSAFSIGKAVNGVGVDASDRGHLLENIEFGGTIRNATNRSVGVVDLMVAQGTWGSGDTVRNLRLKDLVIEGGTTSGIQVDMDPIVDILQLENVRAASALAVQGTIAKGIRYQNCDIGGVFYRDVIVDAGGGTWTPIVAFGGASVGITYASQVGQYKRVGNLVWFRISVTLANKGSSTGVVTVSLPFASELSGILAVGNVANITLALGLPYATLGAGTAVCGIGDGATALTDVQFANNSQFQITGVLPVAA